jgi:hypothetical protein
MNKHNQNKQKQLSLLGALFGCLLFAVPAKQMSTYANTVPLKTEPEKQLAQTNPSPSILNEAPYNRSVTPPLPEQQQPPNATVIPAQGKVSIKLVNATGSNISYEVIGDTDRRSLQGKSNVLLSDLSVPITVTFKRQDGGLLSVMPQSPQPGILEAVLTETTDLGADKNTLNIQPSGAVFLN